jgi:hypothetical protein
MGSYILFGSHLHFTIYIDITPRARYEVIASWKFVALYYDESDLLASRLYR